MAKHLNQGLSDTEQKYLFDADPLEIISFISKVANKMLKNSIQYDKRRSKAFENKI